MLRILFPLFTFLLTATIVNATDYYIDCAGNNANDGLTTGTPWADFNTNGSGHNFLKPGDTVNFNKGCTFTGTASQVWIYSAGTAKNPITFQPYGAGADPIFDASVDPLVDVAGFTGWTVYDAPNDVYVSNIAIPYSVNNIIVDDSFTLRKLDGFQCGAGAFLKSAFRGECQSGAGTVVYIRLNNGDNPNTHTIRFGKYGNGDTDNHTRGQFGVHDSTEKYINIKHMHIKNSTSQGFSSGAPYVNFYNCESNFSAREAWYIIRNATQNAAGAKYNTLNNCTGTWSNSNFGQQFTMESSHVDLIDVISKDGWMAGIDWLDYNSSTDASYGRCIRCIAHDNSHRSWNSDYNGFDPVGIYIDGANNIQIIDSVIYQTSPQPTGSGTQSSLYGVAFQTEHPSTKPDYNIDLINSIIYGINFSPLALSNAINCSGTGCRVNDNIRVIGCTLIPSNFHSFEYGGLRTDSAAKGVFLYNNIFGLATANKTAFFKFDISLYKVTMDYNTYTNNRGDTFMADSPNGTASVTLAAWQAYSSQDAHSQYANPVIAGSGIVGEIGQAYHLSAIAAGQASNSPALAFAYPNYLGTQYVWSSIGTVRTDDVVDNILAPADGYHYLATFQSSTFPSNQSGTDFF